MLGLVECWEPRVFSYRLRPSQYFSFFVWHGGKTETIPRFGGAKST